MSVHQFDGTVNVLKFLKASGVYPHIKAKFWLKLLFCFNCTMAMIVNVLAVMGITLGIRNSDIGEIVQCIETNFIYLHILGKHIALFFNKPILANLLDSRSNFLELNDFPEEIQKKYNLILFKARRFVNTFLMLTISVVCSYYMQPYVTGGDLPVSVYIPEGWYYYIHVGFFPIAPLIYTSIYAPDALCYSLAVPVIVQFNLLKEKVAHWNAKKPTKKDLKEIVDHQNFLFHYCNQLNKFNSAIFLNQFFITVGMTCIHLFVVSQSGFKLPNKIKCVGYTLMGAVQTGIYCFNYEFISEASKDVGNEAYNSVWYNEKSEIKDSISLIIAKAQKGIDFNAYGFVIINFTTFTTIFKTALSFYSYLNQLVLR